MSKKALNNNLISTQKGINEFIKGKSALNGNKVSLICSKLEIKKYNLLKKVRDHPN